MLTQDKLTEAIQEADKAAALCGKFCRYGAAIEDGKIHCWHNGTGSSDTSDQVVYSSKTLGLNQQALTTRLQTWLTALHNHEPHDLNADA